VNENYVCAVPDAMQPSFSLIPRLGGATLSHFKHSYDEDILKALFHANNQQKACGM
jgi:hypothetical protein